MSSRIIIPFLNSIKFVKKNQTLLPQYDKPLFDYSHFKDQQYDWQQKAKYCIKRTTDDADFLQFISNYDPIQIDIRRKCDDALMLTVAAQRIKRNQYQSDFYIYQVDISYSSLAIGNYYMTMTVAGMDEFESQDLQILSSPRNTALMEYYNSEYYGDVVFETGIVMAMRAEGGVLGYTPGSKSVVYEDQVMNETLLSYQPYETYKFFVGGPFGIPPDVHKTINRIIGCDMLRINGQYYTVPDGAKWEKFEEANYAMFGWAIDIRENLNRSSAIYDSETSNGKKLTIVHNIESKGFGDTSENVGSNIIPIIDIE